MTPDALNISYHKNTRDKVHVHQSLDFITLEMSESMH